MIVDPQTVISIIYSTVEVIRKKVEEAKANKTKSKVLLRRVMIVHDSIRAFDKDHKPEQKEYFIEALNNLKEILEEALNLVIKFSEKRHWVMKVANSSTDREAFEEIGQKLAEALPQLNLGVAAQMYDKMFATQDEEKLAEEKELKDTKVKEEILELCKEELVELQGIKQELAELAGLKNITAILNQMKEVSEDERAQVLILNEQMKSVKEALDKPPAQPVASPDNNNNNSNSNKLKEILFATLLFDTRLDKNDNGEQLWKGRHYGQPVLIKLMEKELNDTDLKLFMREIKVLSNIPTSTGLVKFHGASVEKGRVCAVFDYDSNNKTLRQLLDENYSASANANDNNNVKLERNSVFTLRRQLKIARAIARTINFLHQKKFIHRNLTTANILVAAADKTKIAGFQFMKIEHPDINTVMGTLSNLSVNNTAVQQLLSVEWGSPELKQRQAVTDKSDVFSFGGILWEIFTGEKAPVLTSVDNLPVIPNTVPGEIAKLIKQCWAKNPEDRPDMYTVVGTLHRLKKEIPDEDKYNEGILLRDYGDSAAAKKRFEKLVKKDAPTNFRSQTQLAIMLHDGILCHPDPAKAIPKLEILATKSRHTTAMQKLITIYEQKGGVEGWEKVVHWRKELLERCRGVVTAEEFSDMEQQYRLAQQQLQNIKNPVLEKTPVQRQQLSFGLKK